jgi:hypothetical protein
MKANGTDSGFSFSGCECAQAFDELFPLLFISMILCISGY